MKVLIVEDNDRLRRSMLEYARAEGLVADAVGDGEEGLYRAENWDYDVVLLDVMMPRMDGWEVLRKLRETRTTPVIMVTARDQIDDRIRGLDEGADDYLVKPFEMEELMARIRANVRRSKGSPKPHVEVGDVGLNTASRTAYFKGEAVELTAREYTLLEMFVYKRNEVVSRDYIYERLFDDRDESMSNMLEVYVYKLRSKFGKDSIQTRRGMGYIFMPE
ncbi:MAG: response regulator transcription factor [Verrucomicrobiota bacterium]